MDSKVHSQKMSSLMLTSIALVLRDGVNAMGNSDTALADIILRLVSKSDDENDPWTHVSVAGILEGLPFEKGDGQTNNSIHNSDEEGSEDETDCKSDIAVLGEEDEEHNEAAQEGEVDHNTWLDHE